MKEHHQKQHGYRGPIAVGDRFTIEFAFGDKRHVDAKVTSIYLHGDCEPSIACTLPTKNTLSFWAADFRRRARKIEPKTKRGIR